MKRIAALSVALALAAALLCACGTTVDTVSGPSSGPETSAASALVGDIPCAFPLADGGATMNILATVYDGMEAEDVYVWRRYAEMTGVDVNWTTTHKGERSEAVFKALTNKADIDLILRCKISASDMTQFGESGLLLNLAENDLLKTYAPNCWAYLESHPDALASVTNPDGAIYALPQVNSGAELRVSRKLFINKAWLENVGMSVPTTTEELYRLLKAFKEQDANGNGDPNDEIPLCSPDFLGVQEALFGAFGLANRGIHNSMVDCDEATGGTRFIMTSEDYRAFLEYCRQLYSEGLLDKYVFSIKTSQWVDNAANDRIGVFASTNLAGLPADRTDGWVAVEEALEGPGGHRQWNAIRANFHSVGAAAIPATCDDPALALRWLDYFWTDEGTLFYHMGTEGETFVRSDDGAYDYAPWVYEKMREENKSFDDVVATISPYPGGGNPTVEVAPYFRGGEMADVPAAAARKLFEYGPKTYWPSFTFTPEETDSISQCLSDVTKYCATVRERFITGEAPMSDWDGYVAQLEKFGTANLLNVYQAAVDRYEALAARHTH